MTKTETLTEKYRREALPSATTSALLKESNRFYRISEGWTNGHTYSIETPKALNDKAKWETHNRSQHVIDHALNSAKDNTRAHPAEFVFVFNVSTIVFPKLGHTATCTTMVKLVGEGCETYVNPLYLDYFIKQGGEFYIGKDPTIPVTVKKGDTVIGLIMPMRV